MRAIFPFRHVHLDFHTSPLIPGVGDDFDADEFVRTLKDASVDSMTTAGRAISATTVTRWVYEGLAPDASVAGWVLPLALIGVGAVTAALAALRP